MSVPPKSAIFARIAPGSLFPAPVSGSPYGGDVIGSNISPGKGRGRTVGANDTWHLGHAERALNPEMLSVESERTSDLALSEERLRFTQRAGRIGSWTLDLGSMEFVTSDGCRANFGRDQHEAFSYAAWIDAIHADDRASMQLAIEAAIAGKTDYDIEYRIRTPQGSVRWLQFRGQASYRQDGSPLIVAGISIDVTDRKRVEQHRDLLSKELSHRVKNLLAVVQSIARQTLRHSHSLEQAETTLDARIQSLAAAHDVLTQENVKNATMSEVVAVALGPFTFAQDDRVEAAGPTVLLGSRVALAFAMALHELATNAVKYGAWANTSGRVLVSWQMSVGLSSDRLIFRWRETGGPVVVPPSRLGFGSRMIERALSTEIGGTAKIDYLPGGVLFTAEGTVSAVQGA